MLKNGFVIFVGTLLIISLFAPASVLADGSGTFKVSRTMSVGGTEIESGQYRVKYEANGQEADVTFRINGKVAAKVPGRVVEREDKSNGWMFTYDTTTSHLLRPVYTLVRNDRAP